MGHVYRDRLKRLNDNGYRRRNHRGRKFWTQNIADGDLPDRTSYRCPSCSSHVVADPVLPVDKVAVGVDNITVRVPLLEELCDETSFFSDLKGTESGAHEGTFNHSSGAQVYCKLDKATCSLLVNFNPSRVIDNAGFAICPADLVGEVTEQVLQELFQESSGLTPVFGHSENREEFLDGRFDSGWQEELWLVRLDVSRDFQVSQEWFAIEQLRHKRAKNAKSTCLYLGDVDVETWSSVTGKKTGRTIFYDKLLERWKRNKKQGRFVPSRPGVFRFEHQLKGKQLAGMHLHTLADINRASVEAAIRHYWEKATLGTDFAPPGGWMDFLLGKPGIDQIEACLAIAYFAAGEVGRELPLTDKQKRDCSQLGTASGLKPRTALWKQSPVMYRLDLESGTLVVSTPAVPTVGRSAVA